MAEFRKAILLAGLICVAASDRAAGSAVPKWSARQLANFADVIVTGRVISVTVGRDPSVDTIYTYVGLEVEDVLKGPVNPGLLTIKQLGGIVDGTGLQVVDQPTFVVGEHVLLYLEARPRDGSLYTSALWQGKWSIEQSGRGRMAVRAEPVGHRSGQPVDRQTMASVRAGSVASNRAAAELVDVAPADATTAVARPFALLGPVPVFVFAAGGHAVRWAARSRRRWHCRGDRSDWRMECGRGRVQVRPRDARRPIAVRDAGAQ